MRGPLFMAFLFAIIALWFVLLALPGLKPPRGSEKRACPSCNREVDPGETTCPGCGASIPAEGGRAGGGVGGVSRAPNGGEGSPKAPPSGQRAGGVDSEPSP